MLWDPFTGILTDSCLLDKILQFHSLDSLLQITNDCILDGQLGLKLKCFRLVLVQLYSQILYRHLVLFPNLFIYISLSSSLWIVFGAFLDTHSFHLSILLILTMTLTHSSSDKGTLQWQTLLSNKVIITVWLRWLDYSVLYSLEHVLFIYFIKIMSLSRLIFSRWIWWN